MAPVPVQNQNPPGALRPFDPFKSEKVVQYVNEVLIDAHTGRDITRPRDLYSFLSEGQLPDYGKNERKELKSRSVNTDRKQVSFPPSEKVLRRKSQGSSPSTYYSFTTLNSQPPLPAIKSSKSEYEEGYMNASQNNSEQELTSGEDSEIPISVRRGYHKVRVNTTYIFTPRDRLHETVKYNSKVVIPKIKSSRNKHSETEESQQDSDREEKPDINDKTSGDITQRPTKFEIVSLPAKKQKMQPIETMFGVRPECMFINAQLGDRNPFTKDHLRLGIPQDMPKTIPGLQDLKDYDGYPDVYWKVRAGIIEKPEDLEADMIDRDLYRMRQLSTLKLNTIERTFQVATDPFRRRKGRLGEPLFSPKQQKTTAHRKRQEKSKKTTKEGHHSKTMPQVKVTPLKLNGFSPDSQDDPTPNRLKELTMTGKQTELSPRLEKPPPLTLETDTPKHTSGNATRREAVEASLETFRRLQKEREHDLQSGTIPVQKLHQIKSKKEKTALRTALVSVDLDSVNRGEHTRRTKMAHHFKERVSQNAEQSTNPNSFRTPKQQSSDGTDLSKENIGMLSARSLPGVKDPSHKAVGSGSKHTTSTALAMILFDPPGDKITINPLTSIQPLHRLTTNITANDISSQEMVATPNQSENQSEKNAVNSQNGSVTQIKPVHLEVFSEKRPQLDGPIKIPTSRITLHPGMPAYKLDLLNYPPSNARQSCERSNSAGRIDSRQTLKTHCTHSSLNRPGTSHHSQRSPMLLNAERPPKTTESAEVNIRFAGQGQVILTSAAGKTPDRASR